MVGRRMWKKSRNLCVRSYDGDTGLYGKRVLVFQFLGILYDAATERLIRTRSSPKDTVCGRVACNA